MPTRLQFLNDVFTIAAGAVASMFACIAAALPNLAAATDGTILTDTQMRFACIAGALGGAILSVLIFPPRKATHRNVAAKFFASGVSGVIFAPMVVRWANLPRDFDSVIATSAIVALTAIGVLRLAVPAIERIAGKKLSSIEPPKEPPSE